jgi:flagellar protein FliO/FliZ
MKTPFTNLYNVKKSKLTSKFNSLFIKSFFIGLLILSGMHMLDAAETSRIVASDKILPMLAGLLGVLAVIAVLAFIFRKVSGFNLVSRNISVIESQNIGSKEKLVVVEIQGEQYLLGVTSHQINPICELREPITKTEPNLSFERLMEKIKQTSQQVK